MINQALKEIRLFHNFSQAELCTHLGISKSYLSEIESGKKSASLELLGKYSELFKIPVSSLVLFSEELESESPAGKKLRYSCTGKILKLMHWINEKQKTKLA